MRDLTPSDFPFVASLADSANPNDRRVWLRVACDHFVAAPASDAEAADRFAAAVSRQLDKADPSTLLEAAQKLAPCPRTPVSLLAKLATASVEASDFVLERGASFGSANLIDAIESGRRQAMAVARRPDLDARVLGALIARDEIDVLVELADNPRVRLEGARLANLLQRARTLADHGDLRLAETLLKRRPLPPESAALFLVADPFQRVEILLAVQRAQLGRPPGRPTPIASEILDELEQASIARRPEQFVSVLAKSLECEAALAERIVDDPSGEPLAVAMASLGAPSDVLVRVLIARDLQGGETYPRIRSIVRLNNALTRNAAATVMAALIDGRPTRRPAPSGVSTAPIRDPAPRGAARSANSAAAQSCGLKRPPSVQPRMFRAVGAKNPRAIKIAPIAPSPMLNQSRTPISVIIAADASTIAICVSPLPSS